MDSVVVPVKIQLRPLRLGHHGVVDSVELGLSEPPAELCEVDAFTYVEQLSSLSKAMKRASLAKMDRASRVTLCDAIDQESEALVKSGFGEHLRLLEKDVLPQIHRYCLR